MELAELLAIPVLESAAFGVNFPGEHPLHAGYQFTTSEQNPLLAEADVILVLDSDVPWIYEHLRASRPGSLLGSGGGFLGWADGGAVGAKLACPERAVVCLTGDGSFLFGVPSSAQWVARRYGTPALTIIYDNRGWAAPMFSTLQVRPEGAAAKADDFHVSFEPEADLIRTPGSGDGPGGMTGRAPRAMARS